MSSSRWEYTRNCNWKANISFNKISNQKLLQQTGNAMTSSVIEEIAKNLMKAIGEKKMTQKEILINRGSTTAKNGFKKRH